jgi:hypothetical protein
VPDFLYDAATWEINFLHSHPILWWSMVAIVVIPNVLIRLRG